MNHWYLLQRYQLSDADLPFAGFDIDFDEGLFQTGNFRSK